MVLVTGRIETLRHFVPLNSRSFEYEKVCKFHGRPFGGQRYRRRGRR